MGTEQAGGGLRAQGWATYQVSAAWLEVSGTHRLWPREP